MKSPRFALLILVASLWLEPAVRLGAEVRVFTDVQGRTLKAEVVKSEGDQATLKLASGGLVNVSASLLCEADRGYLKQWEAAVARRPAVVDVKIKKEMTPLVQRKGLASGGGGGLGTSSEKMTAFYHVVTVRNRSGRTLRNVELETTTLIKTVTTRSEVPPVPREAQEYQVSDIADGEEQQVRCGPVNLTESIKVVPSRRSNGSAGPIMATKDEEKVDGFELIVKENGTAVWPVKTGR